MKIKYIKLIFTYFFFLLIATKVNAIDNNNPIKIKLLIKDDNIIEKYRVIINPLLDSLLIWSPKFNPIQILVKNGEITFPITYNSIKNKYIYPIANNYFYNKLQPLKIDNKGYLIINAKPYDQTRYFPQGKYYLHIIGVCENNLNKRFNVFFTGNPYKYCKFSYTPKTGLIDTVLFFNNYKEIPRYLTLEVLLWNKNCYFLPEKKILIYNPKMSNLDTVTYQLCDTFFTIKPKFRIISPINLDTLNILKFSIDSLNFHPNVGRYKFEILNQPLYNSKIADSKNSLDTICTVDSSSIILRRNKNYKFIASYYPKNSNIPVHSETASFYYKNRKPDTVKKIKTLNREIFSELTTISWDIPKDKDIEDRNNIKYNIIIKDTKDSIVYVCESYDSNILKTNSMEFGEQYNIYIESFDTYKESLGYSKIPFWNSSNKPPGSDTPNFKSAICIYINKYNLGFMNKINNNENYKNFLNFVKVNFLKNIYLNNRIKISNNYYFIVDRIFHNNASSIYGINGLGYNPILFYQLFNRDSYPCNFMLESFLQFDMNISEIGVLNNVGNKIELGGGLACTLTLFDGFFKIKYNMNYYNYNYRTDYYNKDSITGIDDYYSFNCRLPSVLVSSILNRLYFEYSKNTINNIDYSNTKKSFKQKKCCIGFILNIN